MTDDERAALASAAATATAALTAAKLAYAQAVKTLGECTSAAQTAYAAHAAAYPDQPLYRAGVDGYEPLSDEEIAAHLAEQARLTAQAEADAQARADAEAAKKKEFDDAVAEAVARLAAAKASA